MLMLAVHPRRSPAQRKSVRQKCSRPVRNAAAIRAQGAQCIFLFFCSAGSRAVASAGRAATCGLGTDQRPRVATIFRVEGGEVRKDLPSRSLQLFFPARYRTSEEKLYKKILKIVKVFGKCN